MKICLINPPHPYLKQPKSQAPLGLLYVASSLRTNGIDVILCDFSDKYYKDNFDIPEADAYGITGTVLDRVACTEVAKKIKAKYQKSKVLLGGPIALTPDLVDRTYVDSVVAGEGERVIFSILFDFPNLKNYYCGERIVDLDSLPFPARDLLDEQGGNIFANNKNYKDGGSTVIMTSRGCPFNCAFCSSPGIWGRKIKYRSIINVLKEVDEIIERYGVKQLRFSDDVITSNKKRLEELCVGFKDRDVAWRASIRVKPNNTEMFKMMKQAGCKEVSFGVESGDDDVLSVLNKGVKVKDNYDAIVNANKAGLVVRILFIIGTPGETVYTVDKNIKFLESVKEYYTSVALKNFIPIPGSAIANSPEKFRCRIVDDNIDNYNFYMWGPDGLRQWNNLIELDDLPSEVFYQNKIKMRDYVIECGKGNMG